MSSRRRLLEIIATSFKWLSQSFVNLYYSLIPTGISGKQVKDKARVKKIYGNSEVENQLVQNGNFEDSSVWSASEGGSFSVANNICTYTQVETSRLRQIIATKPNHTYLAIASVKANNNCVFKIEMARGWISFQQNLTANVETKVCGLLTPTSTTQPSTEWFQVFATTDITLEISEVMLIDLTQRYPFDTPTTLTDNRVQAILNRGYIPYNTGTIKSVNMSELGSEPYNLFDEEWEQGRYDLNTGLPVVGYVGYYRSKNKIKVIGGQTYTISRSETTLGYLYEYDINNNFLGNTYISTSTTNDLVLKQNTAYINISLGSSLTSEPTQVCFHRQGTRTGYAPHIQPQTLPFKYQGGGVGTSHDSLEITATEYVFTKNVGVVDLSQLTSTYNPNAQAWQYAVGSLSGIKPPEGWGALANAISDKFLQIDTNHGYNQNVVGYFYINPTGILYVNNGSTTTAPTGTLIYELATPQVIRIPKKRLGVVDLGTLDWIANATRNNYRMYTSGLRGIIKGYTQNVITPKYLVTTPAQTYEDKVGIAVDSDGTVFIYDENYNQSTSATDFKNAMQGIYLFYETAEDVAEIETKINVEAGGTLNGVWFSWVENQQIDSTNNSKWYVSNASKSFDATTKIITMTATARSGRIYQTTKRISGSKYLAKVDIKLSNSSQALNNNIRFYAQAGSGLAEVVNAQTTTDWQTLAIIFTGQINSDSYTYPTVQDDNTSDWGAIQIKNMEFIDLTEGFGAGKEPTSINDPRIQEILRLGYIPTDIQGTPKSIDCEVLPNVDMEIKCK